MNEGAGGWEGVGLFRRGFPKLSPGVIELGSVHCEEASG